MTVFREWPIGQPPWQCWAVAATREDQPSWQDSCAVRIVRFGNEKSARDYWGAIQVKPIRGTQARGAMNMRTECSTDSERLQQGRDCGPDCTGTAAGD